MTTDLNPEGLERAAEALNEQGWTCDGGSHEPEGIDSCPACHEVCTDLARAAVTAYLDAQTVTTVEELDALPVGVTIIGADGWPWLHDSDGEGTWWWESPGHEEGFTSDEIPLPATVLHRPTP